MWIGDFQRGQDIALCHPPVDALLTAAYMRGDQAHRARLRVAFPDLCREVDERYDSPGAALSFEEWVSCHGEPDADTRRWLEQRFPKAAA